LYNRYIPQGDGSYRKNRLPDPQPTPPQPQEQKSPDKPHSPPPISRQSRQNAGGFLRNLLPKEFDTGDLLIVLLLLLMAGDSEDERTNALLTLALYFFM
jgi:hypothetical protein